MSDLVAAVKNHRAARGGQDKAWAFYEGDAPEIIDNPRLSALLGQDNGYKLNFARGVVTSRLNRMEIASVTSPDTAQAEVLDYIWKRNFLGTEMHDAFEFLLGIGEGYLVVTPDEESEDDRDIDIWCNDPRSVRLFYDPANPRRAKFAVKQWQVEDDKTRVNLYYRDRTERYISKGKLTGTVQDSDFVEYVDDDDEDGDWPIPAALDGFLPVFHLRTRRGYGRPEHKEAFGPQNGINKLVASMMGSVDFQGLPQRYALKDPSVAARAGDLSDVDEDFGDPVVQEEAKDPNIKAQPGSMWFLDGIKQVGELSSAKPEVYLEPWRELVNTMSIVTDTPMHVFKAGGQMPTGESRRAAEIPLVNRVKDLQRIVEPELKRMFAYALRLAGFDEPNVVIEWMPPATYDDKDVWATVKAKVDAGVPLAVALQEAGYDLEVIRSWGVPIPGEEVPTE